jgi:putative FmdB family regulatory protein
MPTYEYECQRCKKTFEVFQSISEEPLSTCTCAKKGKVKRLLGTGAGFLFKGSGFYTTDYRSDSYKKAAKADSPSDSGSASASTKTSGKDKGSKAKEAS